MECMKILDVGCVCLDVFEFVNPLSVMIQGCLIWIVAVLKHINKDKCKSVNFIP